MEDVIWEDIAEESSVPEAFAEYQVGSVALCIEPVHTQSPLSWLQSQLAEHPDYFALPVEKDGGVVGLVSRQKVGEKASKFLGSLMGQALDQDLTPAATLDAREPIEKTLVQLFSEAQASQPLPEFFLVFLYGKFYGLTDLRRLLSRSAALKDRDLQKAREIQESTVLKSRLPPRNWDHGRFIRMAYGVGGDFYQEVFWDKQGSQTGDTCLTACFDVSGKAVAASLVTGALAGFFCAVRLQPYPGLCPLARQLNEVLADILPLGVFVTGTLFAGPAHGTAGSELEILNFGFGPVYFYVRRDSRVVGKILKPNLPPLGLDDLNLESSSVFRLAMESGTKVFTFSDGITDMLDPQGERYGEERLREFLSKSYRWGAGDFIKELTREIDLWQGTAPQADDITALTLQF